ncbi:MAG TPA: 50S ribosomal protein L6 [Gammaproteobacteria bacterium]|nr:50S ribosomal protein L6 [Gammaproteobacteria bacterium]
MASRVGRKPIDIPKGVEIKVEKSLVQVKGAKGTLTLDLPQGIMVHQDGGELKVVAEESLENADAATGTVRAVLNNHVKGVCEGFTKKLQLVGVGYRAQAGKTGNRHKLDLTLGLSHPVTYLAPEGIELATPSVTEILVTGIDKQLVGQVAADVRNIHRGIRKPEPYKGKGIRYANEKIILKETKKK